MTRSRLFIRLIIAGLLAAAAQPAAGQATGRTAGQMLTPDRFAYGVSVDTAGGNPVQRFVLPDTVYRIATRADLGDIRLFNREGEPLPYAIDRQGIEDEAPPDRIALPFFPLYATPQAGEGDVRVEVRRTPSGTLVRVDGQEQAAAVPEVAAYVVDASALEGLVDGIAIAWDEETADFLGEATLETSDDLNRWLPWGEPATVAQLRRMGSVLVRDEIRLPAQSARYYRIRFRTPLPPISRVTATLAAGEHVAERRWLTLDTRRMERGVFDAVAEGVHPVDRIRVTFARPNTLARIRIESASEPGGPWRRHYSGTAYRIEVEGQTLESPEIPIRLTHNRYWRIVAGQGAEDDAALQPIVSLGWTPAQVLFLARGEPPYTLAFGNGEVGPAEFAADDLGRLTDGDDAVMARLGEVTELGGTSRLDVPLEIDWKTILLWAALLAGVAILGGLALSLIRQVQRDREAPDSTIP